MPYRLSIIDLQQFTRMNNAEKTRTDKRISKNHCYHCNVKFKLGDLRTVRCGGNGRARTGRTAPSHPHCEKCAKLLNMI